jgi:endonuclease/exonuclease/phosphatase family metal-dependent hydrolase
MPAWIRGMVWLSGRDIARSTIEMMGADGYADAWRTTHPDAVREPGYTFPVWNPHVRLDYVFTPAAYQARVRACEVRTSPEVARSASDHYPLLVELAEL